MLNVVILMTMVSWLKERERPVFKDDELVMGKLCLLKTLSWNICESIEKSIVETIRMTRYVKQQ